MSIRGRAQAVARGRGAGSAPPAGVPAHLDRLLAAVVDDADDLVAFADLDGAVTFRNRASETTLGAGAGRRGRHLRDYHDEETWTAIASEVLPVARVSGRWEGRSRVRHLDTGEPLDVEMTVLRVDHPEAGRPLGLAVIQRPVGDRVDARERSYAEQLRELAEAAVAITSRTSVDGIGDELVRRATDVLRAEEAQVELVGDQPRDHPGDDPSDRSLAVPLLSSRGEQLGRVRIRGGPSRRFTERDRSVLVQLAQAAAVAVEKARLYEVTAREEAIRYREEMMAGVSHDMQTPLAAILGFAEMLASEEQDVTAEERREIHQTLARQAHSLHVQVQRFLDYSVLEADRDLLVHQRTVDVERLIERVVALFDHQREIIVGVEDGLARAAADAERLEQVLTNLLSNAIKYSEEPVRVVARERDGEVLIDVVDGGAGMDEATVGELFRKFHRGPNVEGTPGTGLGLYISKALVEAQGGRLIASSVPGVGSRFRVTLPRASAQP